MTPSVHDFSSDASGCRIDNLSDDVSALEIFELFFTQDIMETIVEQTNIFGNNLYSVMPTTSHMKKWHPTDIQEMYVFLAVTFLMPQVKKQRLSDYWSKDMVIETPFFHQVISRDRYFQLLRSLHFADNDTPDPNDRLFKIRRFYDQFREVVKKTCILSKVYV